MSEPGPNRPEPLTTADGRPLGEALVAAQRRAKQRAFLLVAPLLLFVLVSFVAPIGQMLFRSVHHAGFSANMPNLVLWFDANPRGSEIDETAYAALASDLKLARENRTAGEVGTRINYDVPGSRSLFTSTARSADLLEPPFQAALVATDAGWQNPLLWEAMRGASSALTVNFYLSALDLQRTATGGIERVPEQSRVYILLFERTFLLSAVITILTFVLGYPVAHLLATLPLRTSNILMILVLLPFWTSLLVRTTSWIVLLQSQGVVNNALVATGILTE